VEVNLLGPMTVSVDGRAVVLAGPKERAVLAILALAAPHFVTTDDLIDGVWGEDPPASAPKMLQNLVMRLRKSLRAAGDADAGIGTDRRGYRLLAAPESVDVHRARQRAMQARAAAAAGEHARAARLWADVLTLWRGEPLAELRDLPFAPVQRASLAEQRCAWVEARFDAELAAGRHRQVVEALRAAVAESPTRERLWCQLMLALHRDGRQADALAAYRELRRVLADELGLEPGREAVELNRAIAANDPAVSSMPDDDDHAPRRWARPVPQPRTRFIGRQHDVVEVARLLTLAGCASIVGPGGVGKTRLSLEVARYAGEKYPDGAVLVELAQVAPSGAVIDAAAAALGLTAAVPRSTSLDNLLVETLRPLRMLLVLDNCEHVLAGAAEFAETLLQSCPDLALLVTSRQPLRIDGEAIWRLTPLVVPDPGAAITARVVETTPATGLFLDRARLATRRLPVDDLTAPVVARIVTQLDGLPLAIELAAAALDTLDLHALGAALEDRFGALVDGRATSNRHRTLWAMIDWSYQLLDPPERDLLARVSVFAADFGVDAAQAVAGPYLHVGQALRRLAERSLVELQAGPEPRYRLLDSVRAYARARLTQYIEPTQAYAPLFAWAVSTAQAAAELVERRADPSAVALFVREHANLTGALRFAIDVAEGKASASLTIALTSYWTLRGLNSEGRRWIDEVLDLDIDDLAVGQLSRLLLCRSAVSYAMKNDPWASDLPRAVGLARRAGDPALLSRTLALWGLRLTYKAGHEDEAARVLREAVSAAVEAGDEVAEAVALERLSAVCDMEGRAEDELELLVRAEQLLERHDAPLQMMWVRVSLAMVQFYRRRDLHRAAAGFRDALQIARTLGDAFAEELLLIASGQLALARGDLASADRLLQEGEALAERIEDVEHAIIRRRNEARLALARGDIARALELLATDNPAELPEARPTALVNYARRLAVVAAAAGRLEIAAALLSASADQPVRTREPIFGPDEIDPLLADDLEWATRLTAKIRPSGGASLAEAVAVAIAELRNTSMVLNPVLDRARSADDGNWPTSRTSTQD
jgi:predicted ATPase/DNA-binding SARP family transcriptional activator